MEGLQDISDEDNQVVDSYADRDDDADWEQRSLATNNSLDDANLMDGESIFRPYFCSYDTVTDQRNAMIRCVDHPENSPQMNAETPRLGVDGDSRSLLLY